MNKSDDLQGLHFINNQRGAVHDNHQSSIDILE